MSYVARLNDVRRVPLYRSSFALMLTTGFNGILGFAYWVLAARLYPAKAVGIGAGAISAMTLVSSLGWIGLQYVLLRFVPVAGGAQTRLVRLTYATAIAIGLVSAGVFLAGFAHLAGLGVLTESPLTVLLFAASIVLWIVFSLQDPVLISLRRAGWVPIENAAFGAIKAVLLVALAASASAWAIFGAWVLGLIGLVLVINVALFGRFLRREREVASRLPARRQLVRFAAGHHFVAVTAAIPDSLVSLLVLALLPGTANAYYYSAWAVGFSFRLLAVNMSSALVVEGALAETKVSSLVRQVSRLALVDSAGRVRGVVRRADHARLRTRVPPRSEPAATVRDRAYSVHGRELRHRRREDSPTRGTGAADRGRFDGCHHRARSLADTERRPVRRGPGVADRSDPRRGHRDLGRDARRFGGVD
jgi:O-antigen/teichoic acid export membrane protein